jgi:hypothetical protein
MATLVTGRPSEIVAARRVTPGTREHGTDQQAKTQELQQRPAACENSQSARNLDQSSGLTVQLAVAALAG